VHDGITGVFYDEDDPSALAESVLAFDAMAVDSEACVASADRFDVGHFRHGIEALIAQALDEREREGRAPRLRARRTRGLALSQT